MEWIAAYRCPMKCSHGHAVDGGAEAGGPATSLICCDLQ
jgi:hypothetical protein